MRMSSSSTRSSTHSLPWSLARRIWSFASRSIFSSRRSSRTTEPRSRSRSQGPPSSARWPHSSRTSFYSRTAAGSPRRRQAAGCRCRRTNRSTATTMRFGIEHILTGFVHLLFLLCLIIPLRGWRQVLAIVTTFTVAHSFTLIGSGFHLAPGGAWFPPFVEMTIAASIVYMALENIMGIDFARRMLITGIFGLVHGFGFSYGLQENLQFAGTHLLVSLFAF